MRPLISYYGGKQRIASKILPHLTRIKHTVRAIPFAGGLGMFYNWPKPPISNHNHYVEAINDISELLINMYRTAVKYPEEFTELVEATLYSQADYRKADEILKNHQDYNDLEKAWAYYVCINMGYAHQLHSGWGISTINSNCAATWNIRKRNLPKALERIKSVHIACEDALRFIQRWDSPQTLFYCDPPYVNTNQGHYEGYSIQDYRNLCDLLNRITGSYVLSGYPQEIEPECDYKVEFTVTSSSSPKGKTNRKNKSIKPTQEELGDRIRTEVIWVRDRSKNIRQDLLPIIHRNENSHYQLSLFP
jgi:DNA adenine methylase